MVIPFSGSNGNKRLAAYAAMIAAGGEAMGVLIRAARDSVELCRAVNVASLDPRGADEHAIILREQRQAIGSLLDTVVDQIPWDRAPRKGKADHRKIPRKHRGRAVLLAVGAYLAAENPAAAVDPTTWIMEQAAREHFAGFGGARADRTEIAFEHRVIDALSSPLARDGHTRTRPALEGSNEHERALGGPSVARLSDATKPPADGARQKLPVTAWPSAGGVSPRAEFPEDPESICQREEIIQEFGNTLSPLELEVFDGPVGESLDEAADRAGTTWKTVKTARQRIRNKARAWAKRVDAEPNESTPSRPAKAEPGEGSEKWSANVRKPWGRDRDLLGLIRPMTEDEAQDGRAGYAASWYRRRAGVWGRSPHGQDQDQGQESLVRKAAK